jgi:hypothetical protein
MMRKLTRDWRRCSVKTGKVGIDGDLTPNCSQRRKGTIDSRQWRPSLHDSSLLEVQSNEAELRGYPAGLRVTSINGEELDRARVLERLQRTVGEKDLGHLVGGG